MNPTNLTTKCFFRADGVMCREGLLCYSQFINNVLVEGDPVECPACEGHGILLTESGKDLMLFLETFAQPLFRNLLSEERERH